MSLFKNTIDEIELWENLNRTFALKFSNKIAELLHNTKNLNYKYFEELYSSFKIKGQFRLIFRPKNDDFSSYFEEIRAAQRFYGGEGFDVYKTIIYCDLLFPYEYNCEHGLRFKNVNIFFFSNYENTESFIYDSFKRFNDLKSFI